MRDDLNRRSRRAPFQFTLWGLLWLVALSSVFLAAFRYLWLDGPFIAGFALVGAIVGYALGGSLGTGRLRSFGAVLGGAIAGTGSAGYEGPDGFLIGLAVGACWLLLTAASRPPASGAESSQDEANRLSERLRETRKALLKAALIAVVAGLMFAGIFGIATYATANPLDRWFIATRVVGISTGAALLVALTLAALSLLLALAGRRPTEDGSQQNRDDEDR
jgi:hypothetical protein